MKRLSQISSRSIFIIFWLLTTLFFAQMVWWIIFQVREAERAKAFLIQTVERERGWAAEMLNTRYQEIYQAASKIAKELNGAAPNGIILADPAVYSIVMQSALEGGDIGDYPHFRIPSGDDHLLVFLSPEYPLSIILFNENLSFDITARGELSTPRWITPDMIRINDSVTAGIERDRDRHVKMLVMEGSFFILLIMLGAYAIYLSLRRSRRVREEQLLFVHSITHELKVPLTSMNLFLDTMRRRDYDPRLVSELAPKIKEDIARLSGLIDNVLLVRKLADHEIETKLEVVDISGEFRRFADSVCQKIESTGGRLKANIADSIKAVADLPEMLRVWETIVDNSIKYRGDGALEIAVSLRRSGHNAEIQFQDNGPGIPSGMEQKLFEPFVRASADPKKSVPGSGLGLYIAREYVLRSKGSIAIKSATGGGCVVTIKLQAVS